MPRRGRHRTRLPFRLIAAVAALLVGGTAVVLGGSALAKDNGGDSGGGSSILSALTGSSKSDKGSGDDSSSSDSGKSDDSGDGKSGDNGDGKSGDNGDGKSGDNGDDKSGDNGDGKSGDDKSGGEKSEGKSGGTGHDGDGKADGGKDQNPDEAKKKADQKKDDPFPGRDQIQAAGADEYVDINDVSVNGNIGDGGSFSGNGSYSVDCGVSDHNNSDNYMAAPGKRNGAQHTHDYVGNTTTNANSSDDSLEAGGTSCKNGEKSTFFWPVLRDLNGTDSDANADGGGKDGNVGRKLTPASAKLTFRGHGNLDDMEALPTHLMMIMGNAKAKAQDGKNANAKFTCSGFTDRVTDKYPICPKGSNLVRLLDYPSCWDGQNLESKDLRSHMAYPDSSGNCQDGFKAIPALRITLTYDQPAGRAFAIDSFPDNQHDPKTDHSDFENFASPAIAEKGLDCIKQGQTCINVTG